MEHIPNGVCSDTFKPQDRCSIRRRLGLTEEKTWLGISATHAYSRKGLDVLAAALGQIDTKKIGLLSWGQKPNLPFPEDLEFRSVGHVSDEKEIAAHYSACDLFVCPSRSDNLPNTLLESMACGVPMIGSDAGGIPDMIRPGDTGWLFKSDHPESCAAAITEAIAAQLEWPTMSERCRAIAVREYSFATQTKQYLELFKDLIRSVKN